METFTCAQRGCTFEADELPADCPVCNNPMIGDGAGAGAVTWESFTKAELIEQCEVWSLEGFDSRSTKPELIAILEAADLEPGS